MIYICIKFRFYLVNILILFLLKSIRLYKNRIVLENLGEYFFDFFVIYSKEFVLYFDFSIYIYIDILM